jgi:hypothetical protein
VQSNGIALAFHRQAQHSASQLIGLHGFIADNLSVSHASSKAASNTTSVGGSKELLWKPRIAPLLDLIRTICAISEASAQTWPSL